MKTAILVATLATITASPVLAQSYRGANDGGPMAAPTANAPTPNGGHVAYAAASEAPRVGSVAVYSYDRYAGWDPDPSIRLQLMRDPNGTDAQ